jgi:hypothetical protein
MRKKDLVVLGTLNATSAPPFSHDAANNSAIRLRNAFGIALGIACV